MGASQRADSEEESAELNGSDTMDDTLETERQGLQTDDRRRRRPSSSQSDYRLEPARGCQSTSKRPSSARPSLMSASSCSSRPETRSHESLLGVFHQSFCSSADRRIEVDGQQFAKLCRDCKIVNKMFMASDADMIFRKVACGQCRVTFAQFREALEHAARRSGAGVDCLTDGVLMWTLALITDAMPFGFMMAAPLRGSKR